MQVVEVKVKSCERWFLYFWFMLKFDERGNLKPYSCIPSSIDEMSKYFVENIKSETRLDNFERYLWYSNDLKKHSGVYKLKQWINGSFVTMKPNPKDIDIVTLLDQRQLKVLGSHVDNFKMQNGLLLYGVDAYIIEVYPPNNKKYSFTSGNAAYWQMLFSGAKPNRLGKKHGKGFLEIIY